jgi:hypothetical protein
LVMLLVMLLAMPLLTALESVCCRKNNDTVACRGRCDESQMVEKGTV